MHTINDIIRESRNTLDACINDQILVRSLNLAAGACIDALRRANKIIIIGNGGSAAEAQHIAAELTGRFGGILRPGLGAMTLTSDTAAITAIANDFGYKFIFSRQLEALGRSGDVLIALSTSGNSENVIEAAKLAKSMQMKIIGMTGDDGGLLGAPANILIRAPSHHTPRIQECHTLFGHIICELIEKGLFEGVYEKNDKN